MRHIALLSVAVFTAFPLFTTHAADVTGWTTAGDGPLSQAGTNDPIVGTAGSTDSADNENIYAAISGVVLANTGDSIALTGSVAFTEMSSAVDNFRWGLYNLNGSVGVNGWLGYFASNAITGTGGNLRERNTGSGATFWNATGSTTLQTSSGGGAGFSDGTYTFSLSVARITGAQLQIDWALLRTSGGTAYSISSSFVDTSPSTFVFDRVGISLGGSLNVDQAVFQDITVAVPEPSSICLMGVALGAMAGFQRRRRCLS